MLFFYWLIVPRMKQTTRKDAAAVKFALLYNAAEALVKLQID
jgi:hypothetical protein